MFFNVDIFIEYIIYHNRQKFKEITKLTTWFKVNYIKTPHPNLFQEFLFEQMVKYQTVLNYVA